MNLGLEGKRALVFGASSGLGRAVAEALRAEGTRVAVASRDEARIKAAAGASGAERWLTADLTKAGQAAAAVERCVKEMGGIEVLVVNTGGPPKGSFLEVSAEAWQSSFQNLWVSTVDAIRAALPSMRAQRYGRVILVTSVAAREPMPQLTISNGLRAGLLGLAKSFSQEVAKDGVTVNCLLPGYTDTERLRELGVPAERMLAAVPAGRLGKPEELGAAAAFLASVQAGYITGQALAVDGGYLRAS